MTLVTGSIIKEVPLFRRNEEKEDFLILAMKI